MIIPNHWIETDCGRSESRRPKQKNDCTVRAMAGVTMVSYDLVYDYLAACGRKCTQGFDIIGLMEAHIKNGTKIFGHTIVKHSFPAEKGKSRMNVGMFYMTYPKGHYIIRISRHVAAVRNGYVCDINWDGRYVWRCVYTAFEFIKEK